jgi:hypothetical protein
MLSALLSGKTVAAIGLGYFGLGKICFLSCRHTYLASLELRTAQKGIYLIPHGSCLLAPVSRDSCPQPKAKAQMS